ncbi:MAG: diadenylate cyclase CdaA [Bdellovibrionales bacterium]|nr:diadenylate cyclase CdaA [Bdellovibrionales bacterium]
MAFWTDVDWWPLITGALDVVLVYALIYRLLLLVRGTRAERMLLGLGIVVLVYMASRALNLATLNWILGNFLGSVILVIVVLFQDDFRRALTKVGLIPGFGGDAPKALENSIKEISHAASALAQRRIGALMVLGRDVGLEDYTEHAVKIDAAVSHQLLVSIFLPTSPLHDGATIIEGDRIVAAGAVLPLTFNPGVSQAFGTRHRAAIGLSERTDAVIVVVSEETGTISVIREGRITRDLNEKTLYNALHRLTIFRQQRRKGGRKGSEAPKVADAGAEKAEAPEGETPLAVTTGAAAADEPNGGDSGDSRA